jgi:hypothetical protein
MICRWPSMTAVFYSSEKRLKPPASAGGS